MHHASQSAAKDHAATFRDDDAKQRDTNANALDCALAMCACIRWCSRLRTPGRSRRRKRPAIFSAKRCFQLGDAHVLNALTRAQGQIAFDMHIAWEHLANHREVRFREALGDILHPTRKATRPWFGVLLREFVSGSSSASNDQLA
jgi:hypothetical protein